MKKTSKRQAASDGESFQTLRLRLSESEAERDALRVQLSGSDDRVRILLQAKSEWSDRARKAEANLVRTMEAGEAVHKAASAYRRLCVCYRTKKRPSERLLDMCVEADKAIDNACL